MTNTPIFLDWYHPYAGLCNQLYLITNHIHEAIIKKKKIYINKINIDIFKKCRVPAGDVLDLIKTCKNIKNIVGYGVIEFNVPVNGIIPKLCIYPVSSIEILNCLEFNTTILDKVPQGDFNSIHFRLDMDCIIHYLYGEEYYSYFMSTTENEILLMCELIMKKKETVEYIDFLLKQYLEFIVKVGFGKKYYICTSIGKGSVHNLLLPTLIRLTDFITANGGTFVVPKGEYQHRELNALVDLLVLRDSDTTIGFEGSSFSEGYAFKVNSIRNPNKKYFFVNGIVPRILLPEITLPKKVIFHNVHNNHNNQNVQIFANEYAKPGDNVLIVGETDKVIMDEIIGIFNFIYCDTITIGDGGNNTNNTDFIIPSNGLFPFEDKSFDLVVNKGINKGSNEILRVLKTNGKILNN